MPRPAPGPSVQAELLSKTISVMMVMMTLLKGDGGAFWTADGQH